MKRGAIVSRCWEMVLIRTLHFVDIAMYVRMMDIEPWIVIQNHQGVHFAQIPVDLIWHTIIITSDVMFKARNHSLWYVAAPDCYRMIIRVYPEIQNIGGILCRASWSANIKLTDFTHLLTDNVTLSRIMPNVGTKLAAELEGVLKSGAMIEKMGLSFVAIEFFSVCKHFGSLLTSCYHCFFGIAF